MSDLEVGRIREEDRLNVECCMLWWKDSVWVRQAVRSVMDPKGVTVSVKANKKTKRKE